MLFKKKRFAGLDIFLQILSGIPIPKKISAKNMF